MGCRVVIDSKLCKGCGICVELCPMKALELSSELSPSGYRNPVQVSKCVGCRTCELYCPDFAIAVVCSDEEGPTKR